MVKTAPRRGAPFRAVPRQIIQGLCKSPDSGDKSVVMSDERLDRLTDKQRECLRLVYAHLSSKEIAPRLRVEPGTVDQYIKAAMRTLGVSDRRAAARMLAEQEAGTARTLVYQPLDIAQIGEPA